MPTSPSSLSLSFFHTHTLSVHPSLLFLLSSTLLCLGQSKQQHEPSPVKFHISPATCRPQLLLLLLHMANTAGPVRYLQTTVWRGISIRTVGKHPMHINRNMLILFVLHLFYLATVHSWQQDPLSEPLTSFQFS